MSLFTIGPVLDELGVLILWLAVWLYTRYLRKIFARLTEAVERSHPNNEYVLVAW